MKSKEYFKFVVSKIEKDLRIYNTSAELLKCMYLLGALKKSVNPIKDIYVISRIKNFKILGNYLLFILKKTEAGEVKFDNLIENLTSDKEFILKELLNCFNIESRLEEEQKKEMPEKKETKEEKITGEIKRILAKSRFKVEEIDNELVTEEFIESDTQEDNDLIVRGNYLELLQPDAGFEEASVFSLPTDKPEQETNKEIDFLSSDVFSLPGEKKEEIEPESEIINEQINTEELEEVKLDKPAEETKVEETIAEVKEPINEETGKNIEKEEIPQELPYEEKISTEEIIAEEISQEIINEEIEEEIIPEEKETEEIIQKESEEIYKDTEEVEIENSVYMQYETELMTRNSELSDKFDKLKDLNIEQEDFEEKRNVIIKEIIKVSAYMEEYSRKMSFEVITSMYNVMNMTFDYYGKTVGAEIMALFKKSINLIESLIKGEEFIGFDNVIKSLETLKQTLLDSKKEEIEEKAIEKEKEEPEIQRTTKQFDISDRQKLSQLKQNIIDIENVFVSLEDIKGKFQAYEALRRLSHTFAHLKELVSIANALEMRKLAQLAEASYIFVKFIQNYRMDPFENEISEVFKYIIYNFKLIFLDKPTKDIDLLISYLNDPVKIFEKKEKII